MLHEPMLHHTDHRKGQDHYPRIGNTRRVIKFEAALAFGSLHVSTFIV